MIDDWREFYKGLGKLSVAGIGGWLAHRSLLDKFPLVDNVVKAGTWLSERMPYLPDVDISSTLARMSYDNWIVAGTLAFLAIYLLKDGLDDVRNSRSRYDDLM